MSKDTANQPPTELDLGQIFSKFGQFFQGILSAFFRVIFFYQRRFVWTLIALGLGIGLGWYMDDTGKTYQQKIIVTPNFGSVDYMYDKIALLQAKIKEGDTVFLKSIGINKPKNVFMLDVEPIIDVYNFIGNSKNGTNYGQNPPNFELLKLFSESSDINKVVKDNVTSKNYPLHLITFFTKGKTTPQSTIEPLMRYLNQSKYYTQMQQEQVHNIHEKMAQNEMIIQQINQFLNGLSSKVNGNSSNDKLVYYNENTQLNDVIKTKDQLVYEQGMHRLELVSCDKIIKDNATTINILNTKGLNHKMKLVCPLIFLLLMGVSKAFINTYRIQKNKLASV